jgi:hypothetical protein
VHTRGQRSWQTAGVMRGMEVRTEGSSGRYDRERALRKADRLGAGVDPSPWRQDQVGVLPARRTGRSLRDHLVHVPGLYLPQVPGPGPARPGPASTPRRTASQACGAGFVTYARLRGASDRAVAHQTRHRSLATLGGYVWGHTTWADNAATQPGL